MPLDFYNITDIHLRQKLFEISHADFAFLDEVLAKFKEATGVVIDPYGTTRIYADHVELIKSLIKTQLSNRSTDKTPSRRLILNQILECFSNTPNGLLVEGD